MEFKSEDRKYKLK